MPTVKKQWRAAWGSWHASLPALLIGCLTILAGCKGNPAKEVAEQFLSSHLKQPNFDIIDCSPVDSTTRVSSSAISDMRKATAGRWKGTVNYAAPTPMLRYVKVSYVQDKDTVHQTFYLNNEMTKVVGVRDMLPSNNY